MAVFVPATPGPAEDTTLWRRTVGGAEANVACHLARLGLRARWVGAVGDDALGRAVVDHIRAAGVDVSGVRIDPRRPTGLYLKEPGATGTRMRYYRRGSAASVMSRDLLDDLDLSGVRVLHLTGITAALSPQCGDLLRALLALPRTELRVSFDVNWRPALWEGADPSLLTELADAADIVFVGEDEAEALWGTGDPARVRQVLPHPDTLVVKHGARGATVLGAGAPVFEPALRVDVVDPVGAGDAFAAGFLAEALAGAAPRRCLRAGHLQAAATLCTRDDVGESLPPAVVAELLAADDRRWAAARVAGDGVRWEIIRS
ncbi:MAG TPA: sugar kinase [Pseudonocardiaceae bacterium]